MPFLAQKWWHHWRFWSQQLFGKFLESSRNCLVLEALSASWPPYWQYWEEWVIQTPVFQIWKWFFRNRVHSKYFLWFALTYNFYMIIEKWSLIDYQSIQYHSFCLPNRCLPPTLAKASLLCHEAKIHMGVTILIVTKPLNPRC